MSFVINKNVYIKYHLMKTYNQIREELKSAYPVTHWELKLPIAVNLEVFDIDFEKVIKNLDNIMQQLFVKKD